MMKNQVIKEGILFLVPLRNGKGYALGLLARKNGNIALGYFFNTVYQAFDNFQLDNQTVEKYSIVLIKQFSCIGLISEKWLVIHYLDNWNRKQWPVPEFGRKDLLIPDTYYATSYDDHLNEIGTRKITEKEFENMPADGLAGDGFIELRLTALLE